MSDPLEKVVSSDAASGSWNHSHSSNSNEYERTTRGLGLASPPYVTADHQQQPPGYQSRTNVNATPAASSSSLATAPSAAAGGALYDSSTAYNSSSLQMPEKSVLRQRDDAAAEFSSDGSRPGMVYPPSRPLRHPQAPRIAVTDPLADMRLRNLSKPEGLGANSDWPSREKVMASSGAGGAASGLPPTSAGATPIATHFDGLPINRDHMPVRPGLPRRDSEVSSDGGGGGMGARDDDDFGDEINWSDDEAVEESAKFEEALAQRRAARIGHLSLYSILRFLAVTFIGNLIVSSLLIVPVLVIEFVYRRQLAVSDADAVQRDFVADNIQAWFIWAAFNLHIMWWLNFGVSLVPRVGVLLVQLVWGTANQSVKSVAEFYNAIKNFIAYATYAGMSWASWAVLFGPIFDLYNDGNPDTSRALYTNRVYEVVKFFFFLVLTLSAEKILIKVIAMSFHKSAYAERIDKVTTALRTFDRLKDYRPKVRDSSMRPYDRSGRATPMGFTHSAHSQGHGSAAGDMSPTTPLSLSGKRTHAKKRPALQGQHPSAISAQEPLQGEAGSRSPTFGSPGTPRPGLVSAAAKRVGALPVRVVRSGASTVRTTASRASKIARVALTDPFSLLSSKAVGVGADVNSPAAAKRLAKTIFRSFRAHHRRSYLIPSDFEPAFETVEEARAAFSVFDRDGNGDISQSEIKNTVLQTYKERRFLSKSMQDVNHAVGQLERIFLIIVAIILMFEAFAIFNVDITKTLTTFYTLGIAFAFIFKESAQNVFDSIIFLFVTHPFDTGDRIAITIGDKKVVMVVRRMSLLSSEFTITDGTDMYVANSVLADLMITNYRRSGYQWECATLQVAFDTPLESLDAVEKDMVHWLSTEPERMFEPSTAIVPQKIDFMRSIEVTVGMTHRRTWQDWGMRWQCRNAFIAALCYYMKKHGVRFMASNPPIVYWVDDAAALPPSYEGSPGGNSDDGGSATGRRPSDAGPGGAMWDDSFDLTPPPSPGADDAPTSATPNVTGRTKTFMGFTLPPDELEGSGLRRRRAKARNKGVIQQGGDG